MNSPFNTLSSFDAGGRQAKFHSLPQLEKSGVGPISKLPISIRLVLGASVNTIFQKPLRINRPPRP